MAINASTFNQTKITVELVTKDVPTEHCVQVVFVSKNALPQLLFNVPEDVLILKVAQKTVVNVEMFVLVASSVFGGHVLAHQVKKIVMEAAKIHLLAGCIVVVATNNASSVNFVQTVDA